MKKVIIACSMLFLTVSAFAQTNTPANTMESPKNVNRDPMFLAPMDELNMNKAEMAELKSTTGAELTMEQKVDKIMDRLNKTLNLTPNQIQQIRPLILNSEMQKEQMLKETKNAPEQSVPMIHQVNMQRAQTMLRILTPEQWQKFVQMRKDLAAKGAAMSTAPATK